MASFFDEICKATKIALDSNVQLEKDADVLAKNLERKVKQLIKSCASAGTTTATYDMKTFHVDFMSKYSLNDLLYTKITPTFVPVVHRIFFTSYTPFKGFSITEIDTNVFKVCWTHGIVKEEPSPPVVPRPAPLVVPQPAPSVAPQPVPTDKEVEDFLKDLFPYLQNYMNV
jgi:hypothetical protein